MPSEPLSTQKIPILDHAVCGMFDAAKDQLNSLERAKGKEHLLDDVLLDRVIESGKKQCDDIPSLLQQCKQWRSEKLTPGELQAVER